MEPGSEHAQQSASEAPTSWSKPAAADGDDPPPPAATDGNVAPPPGYPTPTAPRGRIGLIVLTALIVEILFIGAAENQSVSDKILRHQTHDIRTRLLQNSWLTFTWRFSWANGLTSHWVAQLLLVLCVLVFSAAFIWCLLRGPVTWGRAFVGTWLAVLGATVVGGVVRGLIDPFGKYALPGTDRVTRALFGASGPSQAAVVGAVGLGFVVAVVTSIVAVLTRRPAVAAPAFAGPAYPAAYPAPAPAFADYAPPVPSGPPPMRPWPDQTASPRADAPTEQPTTRLPAMPPSPPADPGPSSDASATTRFPRPPDDEDLGHIGH